MTDLKELREAVEAGTFLADWLASDSSTPLRKVRTATVYSAFSGSLDAAVALVEGVLPGWGWKIESPDEATVYDDESTGAFRSIDNQENPARALLIATLKALEAKE